MIAEIAMVRKGIELDEVKAPMILTMQNIIIQLLREIMSSLDKKKSGSKVNNRAIEGSTGIDKENPRHSVPHHQRAFLSV
jgi:hypothetical protein